MSCYNMSSIINILVTKIKWFNSISRNKLLIFLIISVVVLDFFFSKIILYIGLKIIFIIIFLSFGRNDFLQLLLENRDSKVQYSLYCLSMYFTLFIGFVFILTA